MALDKSGKMKLFQEITNWSRDRMRLNEKAINAICEGGADNAITYDEQNLTDEQKAQARENIGATAPEIFWAKYGVTTAEEINAAIDAGKVVMVRYETNDYLLSKHGNDQQYYYFGNILGSSFCWVRLQVSNNTWIAGVQGAEVVNNKSQSIQNDRENTNKYPSVKAVADALGGKNLWTGTAAEYAQLTPSNDIIYFITP